VAELEFNILREFAERIDSKYGAKMSVDRIMNSLHCQNLLKWSEFAERIDNNIERI